MESLRRENKSLSLEIKDLTDQLTEGGRSVHELQKMVRRLEAEKEELQKALDDAESALEAEEAKVLRAQVTLHGSGSLKIDLRTSVLNKKNPKSRKFCTSG